MRDCLLSNVRHLSSRPATANVLRVIKSSPKDLAPVFEPVLEKAHALCRVTYGCLQLYDGTKFRAGAVDSPPEALERRLREGFIPVPKFTG
jgi:hypothetical protein